MMEREERRDVERKYDRLKRRLRSYLVSGDKKRVDERGNDNLAKIEMRRDIDGSEKPRPFSQQLQTQSNQVLVSNSLCYHSATYILVFKCEEH